MAKTNKIDTLKDNLIIALEKSLGIVTDACKKAKCSRTTFYDYCETDPEFKKRVDSVGEMALDFAESSLHNQIKDGIPTSTIFYLKTKGKKRGYVERQEIDMSGNTITVFRPTKPE
jgi:hypothetical protein